MASEAGTSIGASEPRIDQLVLDAGPLVTQQRLTGLAKKYYIPPQVVAELRDKQARDHFEWLRSDAGGCDIEVREAGAEARLACIAFAKKTGDYAVLSQPDMSVLALTFALEVQRHGQWHIRDEVGGMTGQQKKTASDTAAQKQGSETGVKTKSRRQRRKKTNGGDSSALPGADRAVNSTAEQRKDKEGEGQTAQVAGLGTCDDSDSLATKLAATSIDQDDAGDWEVIASDEADIQEKDVVDDLEDDEEEGGEWITPDNISKHKSRALGLVSDADLSLGQTASSKSKGRMRSTVTQPKDGWSTVVSKNTVHQPNITNQQKNATVASTSSDKPTPLLTVACMTGDYAVQNVLLQMGLSLVGLEGQRIRQVKSWVLRCHACSKICKDSERKFCPQCGNPTLLRTSVTSTDPQAAGADKNGMTGGMKVHLKKNFLYKNRGTKYPLPLPRQGKAGGAPASVPILREDQAEWQKALQREKIQRSKEERALQRALERGSDSLSARYEDADELSILLAGKTSASQHQGLPPMGIGRRNPNERRRRKV